jgi:TolB protein
MKHTTLFGALTLGLLALTPAFPASAPADRFTIPSEALDQQKPPTEVVVNIVGPDGKAPRLAVAEFAVTGDEATKAAAATTSQVLFDDLEFEREFLMIARAASAKVPAAPAESLPYDTWNELGADAVLTGTVTQAGTTMTVEIRIMSVEKRASTFGKRYACPARDPRYCAHTIADEVHKELFNLDGIARTKLAFASDRDGERLGGTIQDRSIQEIYISDYDGGKQLRLTPHRSLNITPAWSPDNRFVAYTSYTSGFPDVVIQSIYEARAAVRPVRGTPAKQNFFPAFSPDGTRIAYASSRDTDEKGGRNFEIYTSRVDGTDERRLTSHPGADSTPTWSPNGQQIAFTSDRSGSNQLYLISADGGPVTRLPTGGGKVDRPTWSPPPFNYIAYTAEVSPGNHQVRMIEIGTNKVTTLTEGLNGTSESPSVAPNGRHIAFVTTHFGKQHVAIIGRDGKLERRVTLTGNNRFPSWSKR